MIEQLCPACGFTIVGEGYKKKALSTVVSPVPMRVGPPCVDAAILCKKKKGALDQEYGIQFRC